MSMPGSTSSLNEAQARYSTKEHAKAEKSGMDDMFGSDGTRRVGEEEFANLLEDTDWFPGDFQRGLGNLINAGKVRNLDAPRKRPKKPLHWKKEGERLELVEGAK